MGTALACECVLVSLNVMHLFLTQENVSRISFFDTRLCSTFYETPKRITNEGNINGRDDDHSTVRNPYKQTKTPTVTRMTNEASIVRNPYKKDSWGKSPTNISSSNSLIKKTVRDSTH